MNEALSILEELLKILETIGDGMDITETIPANGDTPALKRSISLEEVIYYQGAINKANKANIEPDTAIIEFGRRLLAKAKWHEE